MNLHNSYYVLRHGEAISNVKNFVSSWIEKKRNPLTKNGRAQIKEAAEYLKTKKIDLIYSSDLLRTKQTAEIVGKTLKISPIYDRRLREYDVGIYNGRPVLELFKAFSSQLVRFTKAPRYGETYNHMEERMKSFLQAMEKKHKGKSILIVSHQVPIIMLLGVVQGMTHKEIFEKYLKNNRIGNGEIVSLDTNTRMKHQ